MNSRQSYAVHNPCNTHTFSSNTVFLLHSDYLSPLLVTIPPKGGMQLVSLRCYLFSAWCLRADWLLKPDKVWQAVSQLLNILIDSCDARKPHSKCMCVARGALPLFRIDGCFIYHISLSHRVPTRWYYATLKVQIPHF